MIRSLKKIQQQICQTGWPRGRTGQEFLNAGINEEILVEGEAAWAKLKTGSPASAEKAKQALHSHLHSNLAHAGGEQPSAHMGGALSSFRQPFVALTQEKKIHSSPQKAGFKPLPLCF